MSSVKRLLAAALPLPWWHDLKDKARVVSPSETNKDGSPKYVKVVWDHYTDGHGAPSGANAELILYAVNHLPIYERLLELTEQYHSEHSVPGKPCRCELCSELAQIRHKLL